MSLETIGLVIQAVWWTSFLVITIIVVVSEPTDYPFEL